MGLKSTHCQKDLVVSGGDSFKLVTIDSNNLLLSSGSQMNKKEKGHPESSLQSANSFYSFHRIIKGYQRQTNELKLNPKDARKGTHQGCSLYISTFSL